MLSEFIRRFLIILPWAFLIWLFAGGLNGEIDGLLVFVLLVILIPVALTLNLIITVLFKGREVLKQLRNMADERGKTHEPLESVNYADLPWWHPKKWF